MSVVRRLTAAVACLALVSGACPGDAPEPADGAGDVALADTVTDVSEVSPADDTPSPDGSSSDGGGPTTPTMRGSCALAERYGAFVVQSDELFGFVDGAVSDGVVPVTILEEVASEGDCRLLRRNNPFCAPPCAPGTTCDFDGSCIPFPEPQDLGTVTIDGLVDGPVVMEPVQPGNTYFDTSVPNPPFADGAMVTMRTGASGAFGEQVLRGVGHAVLSLGDAVQWDVRTDEALTVSWTPPPGADPTTSVNLLLNIDQHGNSPLNVVCEFDDVGSGEVPAAMVTALFDAGVSGFPNGSLTRRTVDSVSVGEGCMEFIVGSPRAPDVRVAGHTPCNSNAECPSGQTCNVAVNTCE